MISEGLSEIWRGGTANWGHPGDKERGAGGHTDIKGEVTVSPPKQRHTPATRCHPPRSTHLVQLLDVDVVEGSAGGLMGGHGREVSGGVGDTPSCPQVLLSLQGHSPQTYPLVHLDLQARLSVELEVEGGGTGRVFLGWGDGDTGVSREGTAGSPPPWGGTGQGPAGGKETGTGSGTPECDNNRGRVGDTPEASGTISV